MRSIKWRQVFFIITCICSFLLGLWNVTQTSTIKFWLKTMSLQKMGFRGVTTPRTLSSELYHAIEILIAFAVPVGLIWLIYFFIARYIFPPSADRLKNISKKYLLKN